jgi:hypothetical protein
VVTVSAALSAALAELARVEAGVAARRRAAALALAATDGCLAEVTAGLGVGWDFAPALAGADGRPGTADDGVLTAPLSCAARAVAAPAGRLFVDLEAAAGEGRRAVRALVGRSRDPGIPVLLWLSDPTSLAPVRGSISLDGIDPDDAAAPPWSGVAAPGPIDDLDALLAGARARIVPSPGTAAPWSAVPPPLADLGDRLLAAGALAAAPLVTAGPAPESLVMHGGDLRVTSPSLGAGLLLVLGELAVEADLAFSGVIATSGGVRVASGATLSIAGALWVGPLSTLEVEGRIALTHDGEAVRRADGLAPLPRLATVVGIRDQG